MFQVVLTGCRYETLEPERRILAPIATVTSVPPGRCDRLIDAVAHADAILNHLCTIDAEIIVSLRRCRVIVICGVGLDSVDISAATARGILVCNVPDYCTDEVATHALALLLAMERQLPRMVNRLRAGEWDEPDRYDIRRLRGRSLGLLGFGRIAQRVGALGAAFGLDVFAHDPYVSPERAREAGATWVTFDSLFANSDYLSLHVPLDAATHHLVNRETLRRIRRGAILINTSRGRIVDEEALIAALSDGTLRGAALDVFEQEPIPPTSPLLHMDNVIVTPHLAWYSAEARDEVRQRAAQEIRRVLSGKPARNPVNHPVASSNA